MRERWSRTKGGPGYSGRTSEREAAVEEREEEELRPQGSSVHWPPAQAAETGTNLSVHPTMITTYGLRSNEYSGGVVSQVTMDDLFAI